MKHYLYKITNTKTNEFYVGVRSNADPDKDKYMGSSSVWTKMWVRDNKDLLIKEIINDSFESRDLANLAEVKLLKQYESEDLCINCLYAKIPSHLGRKQSEEWIKKRIKSGKENGMYGKHHTEAAKRRQSEAQKGKILSDETKKKIGDVHRGKTISVEQKKKMSETRKRKIASGAIKKTYKPVIVENVTSGEVEYFEGCKLFAKKYGLNYGSVKSAARKGNIYLKKYKITYAASVSNNSRKSGELLETPVEDNQHPS